MKRILLLLLPLTALLSCHSDHKKENTDTLNKTNAGTNQALSKETIALIDKFKPILQGVWVKADYLEKIKKTKSPLASDNLAQGMTVSYINTDSIKMDSLIVPDGADNHDGSYWTLYFRKGKKKNSLLIGGGELTYTINQKDTSLSIIQFNEEKKQLVTIKYIRTYKVAPGNDFANGIDYYINKILIAGKYNLYDDTGLISKMEFKEDGKVSGFSNFKTYNINIDMHSDTQASLDEIFFQGENKLYGSFAFKFNADTLNLYTKKDNTDSISLSIDKLKYKLVREKH
jgi:hypothetical protein